MSNISHSVKQTSCNFYTRTKLNISFSFLHECMPPNLVYLHNYSFLAWERSRFSCLSSILIDTIHNMEINTYIATGWIAFARLDMAMRITILHVNVVHLWISLHLPCLRLQITFHLSTYENFLAGPGYC